MFVTVLRGPIHLCACVSKERGDGGELGESVGSQTLSDTLRYINLTDLVIGLVTMCGPIHLSPCVRGSSGRGRGYGLTNTIDTRCLDRCTCVHV